MSDDPRAAIALTQRGALASRVHRESGHLNSLRWPVKLQMPRGTNKKIYTATCKQTHNDVCVFWRLTWKKCEIENWPVRDAAQRPQIVTFCNDELSAQTHTGPRYTCFFADGGARDKNGDFSLTSTPRCAFSQSLGMKKWHKCFWSMRRVLTWVFACFIFA